MPFVLSPRSALASPLRLRSSSVAAAAARGSFILRSGHRPGARRLHVALAADNDRVVLGCGLVTLDYLATVDAYPRPDDKIRTGELKISGRGNAGNALTAARLGLNTRVISKVTAPTTCYACESCSSTYTFMEHPHSLSRGGIHSMIHLPRVPDQVYWFCQVANDETGGTVLSELMEAGIDTSHVIISDGGNTKFVYIIIDK